MGDIIEKIARAPPTRPLSPGISVLHFSPRFTIAEAEGPKRKGFGHRRGAQGDAAGDGFPSRADRGHEVAPVSRKLTLQRCPRTHCSALSTAVTNVLCILALSAWSDAKYARNLTVSNCASHIRLLCLLRATPCKGIKSIVRSCMLAVLVMPVAQLSLGRHLQ